MSGFEFLAVVRKQFPHIATIAMSGQSIGEEPAGRVADAFLQKGARMFEGEASVGGVDILLGITGALSVRFSLGLSELTRNL